MAARDATMHRLRLLQAACAPLGSPGEKPEAWLFVCGVDGKDNWGSAAALRWLVLGESGRGLLEERVRPFFVGNDVPLASDADREAVAEALEETVLLVTRSTVSLLYDARAAPALATLLVCPGLREYVVDGAGGDVDAAEAAKAAGGDFGGFFSQRHDVLDATATFKACVGALDGALLRDRLAASTPALRQHVEETFRAMRGPGGLGVAPDLTEARAAERLAAFFDYGEAEHPGDARGTLQAPFALLGTRTSSSMCADGASDATAADATAPQIVVQARDCVATDATDCDGRPLVDAGELGKLGCLVYVRLTLSLGRLGAVAVGDTFLFPPPPGAGAPGAFPLLQGEGALLTGDRCAPYAPFEPAAAGAAGLSRSSRACGASSSALVGAPRRLRAPKLHLVVAAPRTRRAPALRRLFDNARAKVEGKKAVDGRLAALDHDLRAFRAKRPAFRALTALAGSLRLAENGRRVAAPCGLDGNARVASLWAQPRNHAARSGPLVVVAAGPGLNADALEHALLLASAEPAVPRAKRDRASLTDDDVAALDAAARDAGAPLPPGWAFDGSAYASFDGIRTKLRPDIDALVDAHLAGLNAQIDRENAAIAA
ncbi:hypothetical protein JL721_2740 [Aureococcus anophagefferens]|nr:hypothetical protein JL721_2740 [Aureococcus anophagefferens]